MMCAQVETMGAVQANLNTELEPRAKRKPPGGGISRWMDYVSSTREAGQVLSVHLSMGRQRTRPLYLEHYLL